MVEKILQYKIFGLFNDEMLLSTVKIGDTYETALLFSDMEEYRLERFDNLLDAIDYNQFLMLDCWEKIRTAYPFRKDIPLEKVAQQIYYNPMVGA